MPAEAADERVFMGCWGGEGGWGDCVIRPDAPSQWSHGNGGRHLEPSRSATHTVPGSSIGTIDIRQTAAPRAYMADQLPISQADVKICPCMQWTLSLVY